MNRVLILAALLALAGAGASASTIGLGTFAVNPQASFLYEATQDVNCAAGAVTGPGGAAPCDPVTSGGGPVSALFLNLATMGVTATETIQIIANGSECYSGPCTSGPVYLGGVFDSNNTEMPSSSLTPCSPQPNCAPGADRLTGIMAVAGLPAQPLVTNNVYLDTYYGNVNTTVTNDFYIPTGAGITLVVPAGATYLVVGILDSYYSDDSGNPSVTVNEIAPANNQVPEPATLGLFGIAAAALFGSGVIVHVSLSTTTSLRARRHKQPVRLAGTHSLTGPRQETTHSLTGALRRSNTQRNGRSIGCTLPSAAS